MNISKKNKKIKFLFIRLSSIGDIILTTPLLQAVRTRYPEAKIDFVVAKQFRDAIAGNPDIDSVIPYDKKATRGQIQELKAKIITENGEYDYVIDLQNNLRSRIFRKKLAPHINAIHKHYLKKLLLVHCKYSVGKPLHTVDNYFSTLREFEIFPKGETTSIACDAEFSLSQYVQSTTHYDKIIAIAPGAAHFTKQLPVEKFAQTMELLQNRSKILFLLLGGKSDIPVCEKIAGQFPSNAISLAGKLKLQESAKAISLVDLIITNDTGLMHIASAVKVPIVAIFGSTTPKLGFTPYNCVYRIIEKQLPCRPCTHIGRANCPNKHFACMQSIDPKDIFAAASDLLNHAHKLSNITRRAAQ